MIGETIKTTIPTFLKHNPIKKDHQHTFAQKVRFEHGSKFIDLTYCRDVCIDGTYKRVELANPDFKLIENNRDCEILNNFDYNDQDITNKVWNWKEGHSEELKIVTRVGEVTMLVPIQVTLLYNRYIPIRCDS